MRRVIVAVCFCCSVSGCAGLMLEERERALDEAYRRDRINKIEYLSSKNELMRERAEKAGIH